MQIQHLAGYQFISLTDLNTLRQALLNQCKALTLKGTILLSEEGININIAGSTANILAFKVYLKNDERFSGISFHETQCVTYPYKRLKIKIKKEIITLRQPKANPTTKRAPCISPAALKQWLDKHHDFTLLDTRNDYEISYGTFRNAKQLHLSDFSEFPSQLSQIEKDKPIVLFCTGGIRCEKAALHMLNQGFSEVYQLDGGILGYFAQVGGAHYEGECFVFDERVALNSALKSSHPM